MNTFAMSYYYETESGWVRTILDDVTAFSLDSYLFYVYVESSDSPIILDVSKLHNLKISQ